jgi:hypothetical protein
MRTIKPIHALTAAILALVMSACGPGNVTAVSAPAPGATAAPGALATATPAPIPTATPTPTPPSGGAAPLSVNVASASIIGAGNSATFTAAESGYTGVLSATGTACGGIATFTPASATGPNATFAVVAVGAGSCQIVVKDSTGQSVTETIFVTTTTGTIN